VIVPQADIGHIHPHQLRHTAAHVWTAGGQAEVTPIYGADPR
jgi:integrase